MHEIEYHIFREAAGNRPLSPDKIHVGFKYIEDGEITHSDSFSVPELREHIGLLEAEGRDTEIFKKALDEVQRSSG